MLYRYMCLVDSFCQYPGFEKNLCGRLRYSWCRTCIEPAGYPLQGVGVMTCMILARSDRLHHQQRAATTTSDKASNAMLPAVTICHLNNLLRNYPLLSTVTAILSQNLSQNPYFLPFLTLLDGEKPLVLILIEMSSCCGRSVHLYEFLR